MKLEFVNAVDIVYEAQEYKNVEDVIERLLKPAAYALYHEQSLKDGKKYILTISLSEVIPAQE